MLWLWCRLAAVALIRFLPWELLYAPGVALKSKKKMILGGPLVNEWVENPTSIHEDADSIPGLSHWVKDSALP